MTPHPSHNIFCLFMCALMFKDGLLCLWFTSEPLFMFLSVLLLQKNVNVAVKCMKCFMSRIQRFWDITPLGCRVCTDTLRIKSLSSCLDQLWVQLLAQWVQSILCHESGLSVKHRTYSHELQTFTSIFLEFQIVCLHLFVYGCVKFLKGYLEKTKF
jgi:hypothetical protein